MPIFELNTHGFGLSAGAEDAHDFAAQVQQVLQNSPERVLGEQVFTVGGRAVGQQVPALLALDVEGQPVIAEVIQHIDAGSLLSVLALGGQAARISLRDLAEVYFRGTESFAADYEVFRLTLPVTAARKPSPTSVRLIVIYKTLEPAVLDALDFLYLQGITLLKFDAVGMEDGRQLLEVSGYNPVTSGGDSERTTPFWMANRALGAGPSAGPTTPAVPSPPPPAPPTPPAAAASAPPAYVAPTTPVPPIPAQPMPVPPAAAAPAPSSTPVPIPAPAPVPAPQAVPTKFPPRRQAVAQEAEQAAALTSDAAAPAGAVNRFKSAISKPFPSRAERRAKEQDQEQDPVATPAPAPAPLQMPPSAPAPARQSVMPQTTPVPQAPPVLQDPPAAQALPTPQVPAVPQAPAQPGYPVGPDYPYTPTTLAPSTPPAPIPVSQAPQFDVPAEEEELVEVRGPIDPVLSRMAQRLPHDVTISWVRARRGEHHIALLRNDGFVELADGIVVGDLSYAAMHLSGATHVSDPWLLWKYQDQPLVYLRDRLLNQDQ